MANIKHNSGLPELMSEIGFDTVKYFGGAITSTAHTFTINPPAKRLIIRNAGSTTALFIRVNDGAAQVIESLTPGEDIKVSAGCTFNMDYDTINQLSLVSSGTTTVEGILGWKGIVC